MLEVAPKIERARRSHDGKANVWYAFSLMGLVGWGMVVPMAAAIYFERWRADEFGAEPNMLGAILIGLVLGTLNAARWMRREKKNLEREEN